ncbi:OprD family porin [Azotobacter chroococcum]|uniref:Outer membrane OprD family porin n=1 Tax=Azotobacter chroococcum TaxID=353 RepID=A0A4V2Q7E9_9GAMM|nr:OprD family porin [Azotobacter chroococcum]TBV99902.1 OprD family porin [Azotobacter chroococcum]TCL31621.1 outer membrane OprD family porin [Azotobacter chroococcum]
MLDTRRGAAGATVLLLAQGTALGAGFIEDSQGSLTLRNFYFDRDYKGESNVSARREWAQGFILNLKSGFTEGPVGFGLDLQGMLGVQLDSSRDRVGTGLLPVQRGSGEAAQEYSELGITGKMRYSKTELHVGTVMPRLPILISSPARLLWQTFRGGHLRSQDIRGLSFQGGYLNRMNQRDSTDYQKIAIAAPNGRFDGTAESDEFIFLGGDYALTKALSVSYYHARLDEIYQQNYLGAIHQFKLGPGEFKTDFRWFLSDEEGDGKAGSVDNQYVGVAFGYKLGGHRLTVGGALSSGDSAMPYIAGSEPHLISEYALSSEFLNADEHYWNVRYDYDFAAVGLPGLTGMLRFMKGTNVDLPERLGGSGQSESERDLELSYVVQSGPLKNVALRVRNARYQNSFAANATMRDDNETRVNVDYTWKLW